MTQRPRFFWVLLMISVLILAACGGDENEGDPSPTPPTIGQASPSPQPGVNTPTPLPTIGGQPPAATATRFIVPTSAAPTSIANVPTQAFTNAIGITAPASNTEVRGAITITGSASHPNFVQYALEYGPDQNPGNLWYPITTVPINSVVLNNVLGAWNTTTVADGAYQLRLHVWLNNGTEEFRTVTGIQVRNSQQQPNQTNRNPTIAPIAPVTLTRGNSVTLALAMSDPDNDPLTYIAQVANPGIATVTPAGSTALTVNGIAAGSTTITINISDQRGGTATTTFTVTVNAPATTNNPPALAPIPSQSVNTGANVTVNVVASDPDQGDTLTLEAVSSAPGVASVALNNAVLTITGNSQGSASITVTARDRAGLVTTTSFLITVITPAPANQPPTITTIGNQTLVAGTTQDITLSATDPNNDPLTITVSSSNNAVVSAQLVNNTSIRVQGVAAGNGSITVAANDNKGGTATTTFAVTVNAPEVVDNPPTITQISPQTVLVGEAVTVNIQASDPEGKTVTLTAEAVPADIATLSLNGSVLTITGANAGTAQVTVSANDGTKVGATTFAVEVTSPQNTPPTIQTIGDLDLTVGQTSDVIPVIVSDPDNDPITISATSSNDGLATVSVEGTNLTVRGTGQGDAIITVVANDGEDDSEEVTFTARITPEVAQNTPPVIAPISPISFNEDAGAQSVPLNITDEELASVTINASSSDPANIVVSVVSATELSVNVAAPITVNQQATITVTATDAAGLTSDPVTFIVDVLNVEEPNNAPAITGVTPNEIELLPTENETVTITATDPDNDPITLSAASSDTGLVGVTVVDGSTIQVSALAPTDPNNPVVVTVTASDGELASDPVNVTVRVSAPPNTPPTISGIDQTSPVVIDLNTNNTTAVVNVTVNDAEGSPVTISATSSDSNVVTVQPTGATQLTITAVTQSDASATITVTATDDQNQASAPFDFEVQVNALDAPPPTFDINTIPEIPNTDALQRVQDRYNTSSNPDENVVFVGDESVADPNFLPSDVAQYAGTGDLQDTINFFTGSISRVENGNAAGQGFTPTDVLSGPSTCGDSVTRLQCDLSTQPMVVVISFTPANATRLSVDDFGNQLADIIQQVYNAGAIPVVALLPNDNSGVSPETLNQYNERIYNIANDPNRVPAVLWNVYTTLNGVTWNSVEGSGAADLGANGGWNRRNRSVLQVLQAIRSQVYQ